MLISKFFIRAYLTLIKLEICALLLIAKQSILNYLSDCKHRSESVVFEPTLPYQGIKSASVRCDGRPGAAESDRFVPGQQGDRLRHRQQRQ